MEKKNMDIKISVIIPTYNTAELIKKALDSVLKQTYKPYEIIVVDDGSTDNTKHALRKYYKKIKYYYWKNHGLSAARNKGIKKSKGELIALLDSDDYWHPDKLKEQVKLYRKVKHKKVGLIDTYTTIIDENNNIERVLARKKSGDVFKKLLFRNLINQPSSVIITREALSKIGLFNEELPAVEDWEMWVRIASQFLVYTVPKNLTYYYKHSGNMSNNFVRMHRLSQMAVNSVIDKFRNLIKPRTIRNMRVCQSAYYLPFYFKGYRFRRYRQLFDMFFMSYPFFFMKFPPTLIIYYYLSFFPPQMTKTLYRLIGKDMPFPKLPEYKVSVIIPTYNQSKFLETAIKTALSQTYKPYEIIVVDDGSTDNTKKLCWKYKKKIKYIYQKNKGTSAARNTGINHATGDFIALLDSDDYWHPDKTLEQLKYYEIMANPNVGIIDCYIKIVDINGDKLYNKNKVKKGFVFKKMLYQNIINSVNSVLIKKDVFDKVGLFDESIKGQEDWEMWVRIAKEFEIHTLKKELAIYLKHDAGYSSNCSLMVKQNKETISKVINKHKNELTPGEIKKITANQKAYYLPFLLKSGKLKEYRVLFIECFREYPGFIFRNKFTWTLHYFMSFFGVGFIKKVYKT